MFVKKFQAETFEEALANVKAELGPSALILSQQRVRRKWFQKPSVEVTAAIEKKTAESTSQMDDRALERLFPHRRQEKPKPFVQNSLNRYMEMSDSHPDESIGEVPTPPLRPKTLPRTPETGIEIRWEKDLRLGGFLEATARDLARQLSLHPGKDEKAVKEKAAFLTSKIHTLGSEVFSEERRWVALGAPGSGKTTFLTKLGHTLKERHQPVELISLDSRKMMGRAELAAYAKCLGVAFQDESKMREGVIQLIDTPSCSWRKPTDWEVLENVCKQSSVVIVLDATQRLAEMLSIIKAARFLNPKAIALTRLDLVSQFGVVYEVLAQSGLPLLAASSAPSFKVPLSFFDVSKLAHFIAASTASNRIQTEV